MSIGSQKCLNHPAREAVARCPECRRFYCRECVTEHDDRIICSDCLVKGTARADGRRKPFESWTRMGQALLGLVAAWFFFYLVGQALIAIPHSFHEGTIWKQITEEP